MQHSEKCDYSSAHRDSGGDPDDAGCCRFFVGPVGAHYFHCLLASLGSGLPRTARARKCQCSNCVERNADLALS